MTVVQNSQTVPTAIGDKTYPWAMHTSWGYFANVLQNVIETIGGYTYHKKLMSGANPNYILGSTAGNSAVQVITTGITNPDVARVLTITIGGSGEGTGNILITGVNVEGKPITDTIAYTTTGQVTGALAFKRVSSITLPAAMGSSATLIVGTSNRVGLQHRCVPNYTSIVCISATVTSPYTGSVTDFKTLLPVVEPAVTASNFDEQFVEKNWAQPSTSPNGTTFLQFYYWFYNVLVYPPKDSPEFYSTTTSTSTSMSSTSTSLSTSTSISSTSTSVSSTSASSTSSSISSTSASSTSSSTSQTGTTTSVSTSSSTSISSTSTSTTTLPF